MPLPYRDPKPESLRFLTKPQLRALLDGPRKASAARDYYLLASMFALGLRIGEAVLLRPSHLRIEYEEVLVPTLKRKLRPGAPSDSVTGKPVFSVPLVGHVDLLRSVRDWAKERTWVFVGIRKEQHLSPRAADSIFRRWRDAAGLDHALSPHSLRHTAGSLLYEATKNIVLVQRFLRHADIETTSRYYLHVTDWKAAKGALDL